MFNFLFQLDWAEYFYFITEIVGRHAISSIQQNFLPFVCKFLSEFSLSVTDEIFYDPRELNEIDDLPCAIDSVRRNSEKVEQCVESGASLELIEV